MPKKNITFNIRMKGNNVTQYYCVLNIYFLYCNVKNISVDKEYTFGNIYLRKYYSWQDYLGSTSADNFEF
ncbi:ras GTPase-activating-like protein IQGAP1 isoform X1 [Vespula maculifrons]|uniref:Ras GTPase-activating-like protein IQGAP1 isoform X1 n=1 Tax=Vespula maculifrons TaxID=7453 RepID=A0ABD2CBT8_VESMC